ncbi:MAG TPA: NADH-quinone oxidoreductase subunit NuoN [Allosphingosinicella sp.]|nr:NADH-quinone oxidoreductase subunit NuoN [Allosphingosinicella sp.]
MLHDLTLVAPELLLTVASIALLLVAAWGGDRSAPLVTWLAVASLAGAAIITPVYYGVDALAFGGLLTGDLFAAFSRWLIYAAAAVALLAAMGWFARSKDYRAEFPVLILFSAIGMGMMVAATDLLTLYVGLELLSLSSYVLASFQRTDARSAEAGLKYFILGSLASGLLLYGISLLYGFTGSTLFSDIALALEQGAAAGHSPLGQLFGIVFVLAGIAFKVSAVPFHMWTPDVYEGAPTPVAAYFSAAPKVAAMVLLTRIAVDAMGPAFDAWRQIIIFMALASTILGGVAAIGQRNIKRLLAYSSINNVGFALVGLAAAGQAGVASVLVYMAVYTVMTLGSFLVVMKMRDEDGQPLEAIDSLSGLARTRPGLALAMAVFMLSLAGIPPLFGFYPKLLVFDAAVQADLAWLAAVAVATSVIGAFYYIKIVKIMYFDEAAPLFSRVREPIAGALILIAALAVSPLGYLSIPYLEAITNEAAASIAPQDSLRHSPVFNNPSAH